MTEELYNGVFLSFKKRDGWEFAERTTGNDVVVIFPRTVNNEWLLVEQYRIPLQSKVIEFPAGIVGDVNKNEPLIDAAKRELLEETGYEAKEWKYLFSGPSSSGLTSEIQHFYLADYCTKVSDKLGVDGEKIKLHVIPDQDLFHFLVDQTIIEGVLADPKVWMFSSNVAMMEGMSSDPKLFQTRAK